MNNRLFHSHCRHLRRFIRQALDDPATTPHDKTQLERLNTALVVAQTEIRFLGPGALRHARELVRLRATRTETLPRHCP